MAITSDNFSLSQLPADGLICRRLIYDPSEWEIEEEETISRMKLTSLIDWSLLERSSRSIAST
jgi:hypothetical protein